MRIKIKIKKGPLEKQMIKTIWTTCRRIQEKLKKGANTVWFVARTKIPVKNTVTYSRILVSVKTQKEDPALVCLTVGGNQIDYLGKSEDKEGRSHYIQNTYQFRNLHTRRKIFQMGNHKLLPKNNHGTVRIYDNTHQMSSARNYCALQLK